jgi:hypothetical protein
VRYAGSLTRHLELHDFRMNDSYTFERPSQPVASRSAR